MMKRGRLSAGMLVLAFVLTACGTGDTPTNNEGDASNTTGNNVLNDTDDSENMNHYLEANTNDIKTANDTNNMWYDNLDFYEFALDVAYSEGEYEVEYKYNDGHPEAEIEDSRAGSDVKMSGEEALNELGSILPELAVTADSSDDHVFEAVINAFELADNYEELEVEIDFFNDSDIDVENNS
ncbi:YusW family protein [Salipaludibacillus sp. LMS25]|uniref:YusW family protein n=1 Tax=Salipaludibacillus sp. LMS25 TaxID=2924031 RepID=UPI0020D02C70|nr:YusW family protein [Salipaludibacillus sp. LMS25]UTR16052.1 YusW family protein [Salipaludibacillus sp. LMS25]